MCVFRDCQKVVYVNDGNIYSNSPISPGYLLKDDGKHNVGLFLFGIKNPNKLKYGVLTPENKFIETQ